MPSAINAKDITGNNMSTETIVNSISLGDLTMSEIATTLSSHRDERAIAASEFFNRFAEYNNDQVVDVTAVYLATGLRIQFTTRNHMVFVTFRNNVFYIDINSALNTPGPVREIDEDQRMITDLETIAEEYRENK